MIGLGLAGFAALIALVALGLPIGLVMMVVGFVGLVLVGNIDTALTQLTSAFWSEGSKFVLIALPFYVLMGNLIYHTGIARNLYRAASHWLGWLPGGLGIASVFASAGFGAVSGSSTATARTMGAIVIPEMRRHGYGMRLATGVLSSAGTLGILIPPSIILIFYGLLTETSIGKLFVAGIVPGLIIATIFSILIMVISLIDPEQGGRHLASDRAPLRERIASLAHVFPVLAIFGVIFGGLYNGVFTPTEGAIFGVVAVLIYGAATGSLSFAAIRNSFADAALVTVMLFVIIVGGTLVTRFLAQTGFTGTLRDLIQSMELGYVGFIFAVTILYLVLGCVLDTFGMLILTVPILFPLAQQLGIDPVWFGIYAVIVTEVGLVTPPIGVNVYVIKTVAPDVPLGQIFLGCTPFVLGLLAFVALMAAEPSIILWLVGP
ncbi:TRAP transporter large permease [Amorphus sp. 3PC139-8]|uniref:TRAP transporter large permease n=1 Tax=Amorphus sp. 3PC139-8 TaxID=2735676 RepID=UPI00345D3B58